MGGLRTSEFRATSATWLIGGPQSNDMGITVGLVHVDWGPILVPLKGDIGVI